MSAAQLAAANTVRRGKFVAVFLVFHTAFAQLILWKEYGPQVGSYHGLWICSVSMLLSAVGMFVNSPACVGAALVAVSTGHFLWTLDSLYMLFTWSSQTIFQIANYNSVDGEPTRETVFTTSHHMWFIPLCVWWFRSQGLRLDASHLWWSAVWICLVSAMTAFIVPLECVHWDSPKGPVCINLNVNMVKQWWGLEDVYLFHALDRNKGNHAVIFFIYANFIHNILFNGFWWSLLKIAINPMESIASFKDESKAGKIKKKK
jgi:hypothetical protein